MHKHTARAIFLLITLLAAPTAIGATLRTDSVKPHRHTINLGSATVYGSGTRRINRSAYNAVAVDLRKLRNTNMNLGTALDRVPGMKLREDGGLGSAASLNLNGFTGKHVKVFIDGVPMDGTGAGFSIQNIPVSLARSIEVYKGVVPVAFGGDALGGAVNIVTDHSTGTFVDASYSFGSFNTHRTNLSVGHTTKRGWTFRLNAYQNFSDNDYKVRVQWTDLNTMAISDEEGWFRRFNDRYHNEAVVAQVGLVNKPWADRLVFGLTYSHEYAEIQNANLMKIVFGRKHRKSSGWSPSLTYAKRDLFTPGLDVRLSARYDIATTQNIDTAAVTYSWTGDYIRKSYQGEGIATLAKFKAYTFSGVANVNYRLGEKHTFSLNHTYTHYRRTTTDDAANAVQSTAATYMRRINAKNVTGLSYSFLPSRKWNAVAFGKFYTTHVRGPVNVNTGSGRAQYEEQARTSSAIGYGLAGTYFINRDLQVKLSYEKAYRLPNEREIFGDGDYEEGQTTLRPEHSHNINLNLSARHTWNDTHSVEAEVALNHRRVGDYIIRTIGSNGTAISTNHGKIIGWGADVSAHYFFKNALRVGGNYSLQSMRDHERYNSIGAESSTYGNRVPNLPYAFGNADASYSFRNVLGHGNRLTLGYALKYVHRFYRTWRGNGAKLFIPDQLSHDLNLTYSLLDGKLNLTLEANNIANALLYDNYSLQKPGRNFSVKVRYVFHKTEI